MLNRSMQAPGLSRSAIRSNNRVIVCDAKSFRLGRSQKAPNVKVDLKLADIQKWLSNYDEDQRIGGGFLFRIKAHKKVQTTKSSF